MYCNWLRKAKCDLYVWKQNLFFRPNGLSIRAAGKVSLIVIQLEFYITIEIPIDPHSEILRFSGIRIKVRISCYTQFEYWGAEQETTGQEMLL